MVNVYGRVVIGSKSRMDKWSRYAICGGDAYGWTKVLLGFMFLQLYMYSTVTSLPENSRLTFDLLLSEGIRAYHDQSYDVCMDNLEASVRDYHFYKNNIIACRMSCRISHRVGYIPSDLSVFQEAECVQKCSKDKFADRPRITYPLETIKSMENRKLYSYLQFCYYKLGRYDEAASAAYTFYLRNPTDQDTVNNLRQYRSILNVKDEEVEDLERQPYQKHYKAAEQEYDKGDWVKVIELSNLALTEYYAEHERCQAWCEVLGTDIEFQGYIETLAAYQHLQCRFYKAIKGLERRQIKSVKNKMDMVSENLNNRESQPDITNFNARLVTCKLSCEEDLGRLYSEVVPYYLAEHYNYLQYAHFQLKDYEMAVVALASYLLLNPENQEMRTNKGFYIQKLGFHEAHFQPTQDVVTYFNTRQQLKELQDWAVQYQESLRRDVEDDGGNDADDVIEGLIDINNEQLLAQLDSESREDGRLPYLKVFEKVGVKVVHSPEDLGGPRYVARGFIREDQCDELVYLASKLHFDDKGITKVDVSSLLQMVKEDESLEVTLRLMLKASEISRFFTARFFNQSQLFIRSSHLVCRQPQEDGSDTLEAEDRCVSNEFAECRDLSSNDNSSFIGVAYLTENEDGGLAFIEENGESMHQIDMDCGYLVGFLNSQLHSILPFSTLRCAIVSEYSTERSHDNPAHRQAMSYLLSKEEARLQKLDVNNTQYLAEWKRNGMTISQAAEELHGKERFVADGLLGEEECELLVSLAQNGATQGDGYKDKGNPELTSISPHTVHERFEGLTIRRGLQLAKENHVKPSLVKLFVESSEKGRELVEKYFNLTRPLYFDYTHLVCRSGVPVPGGRQRDDLSHPVHADNCLLQDDGSCTRTFPAYIQRDYSAILYLNDNFEGGEFFFAKEEDRSPDVKVRPKCGRLVGFNAGDLHGVEAVVQGQRCAVAMWYTLDPSYQELSRVHALEILQELDTERESQDHAKGDRDEL